MTKELSATTRMVLDSVRTLVVWLFSLYLFDQKFIAWQVRNNPQLIFFLVLCFGYSFEGVLRGLFILYFDFYGNGLSLVSRTVCFAFFLC